MSPYRKRFVQFNMLLIGIVLTVMVAAVAVYMVNDYYNSLRVTMEQVVAPLQGFSQPPKGEPPREKPDQERAEQKKDILTVFYSPESGAYSVLSPNNAFTDEELRSLLSAIVSQKDDFGTLRQHGVIYYRSGSEPCRIAIATKAALEMESIAYEKCVTLETALPEACIFRGNTDYLQRIVSSLLENALKYEPAGGRVQLTLTQDKRRVQLSVQNFGSTIPAEDLPHVFDRFYRSDKSRKSESGSFGLGLAITKEMVEKLGGEISVSSSAEGGTVFQVTLCR